VCGCVGVDGEELYVKWVFFDFVVRESSKGGTQPSGKRGALISIPKITGSYPSGGSELTFRSALLLR
jgi:hypothetical protein